MERDLVEEREVKSRVKISLGTYVFPDLPFPYEFGDLGGLVGILRSSVEKVGEDNGVPQEAQKEKGAQVKENEAAKKNDESKTGEKMDVEPKETEKPKDERGKAEVETDKMDVDDEGKTKEKEKSPEKEQEQEDKEKKKEDVDAKKKNEGDKEVVDDEKEKEKEKPKSQDSSTSPKNAVAATTKPSGSESPTKLSSDQPVIISLEERGLEHRPMPASATVTENPSTNKDQANEKEDQDDPELLDTETRVTVIIPSGYLPLSKPKQPKIWGGGVVGPSSVVLPPNGYHNADKSSSGRRDLSSSPQQNTVDINNNSDPKPRPPQKRRRRVYTDDSDIFLCALHSGWITWSSARKARIEGKDLKVDLRVIRCVGAREEGFRVVNVVNVPNASTSTSSPPGAGMRKKMNAINGRAGNGLNGKGAATGVTPGPGPVVSHTRLESSSCRRGREEVIGRFLGGTGEKYFGGLRTKKSDKSKERQKADEKTKEPEKPVVPPTPPPAPPAASETKEEGEVDENEEISKFDTPPAPPPPAPEPVNVDADGTDVEEEDEEYDDDFDPTAEGDSRDDGRSLLSAGWGSGHDGSAIEIIQAEYVEKTAHRTSGVRNRSQRLFEYAERRASVLGSVTNVPRVAPFTTTSVIGCKRRRPWEAVYPSRSWSRPGLLRRQPNAVALDPIKEVEEEVSEFDRCVVGLGCGGVTALADDEERRMKMRTVLLGKEAWASRSHVPRTSRC
ncbi:hypothetical protein K435DRAFT_344981 [Dendrothele bispora CBS 962.96]|uniref:Uncharacterized protein n=1 Tax=Dendrothele bispora (strain CBS 962.96) TaxID=1314807 RepID=A0A4S8MK04_DENBC|nr:hypothetical protein K435DRAFT_344981 [Dendrothele bispora CBS 962.96]